jgi:hypothetical protein
VLMPPDPVVLGRHDLSDHADQTNMMRQERLPKPMPSSGIGIGTKYRRHVGRIICGSCLPVLLLYHRRAGPGIILGASCLKVVLF